MYKCSLSPYSFQLLLFLVFLICASVLCLITQLCPTLWGPMDCSPPGSSAHGDSPGKNTGMSCHALLQGILPNRGIEPRCPTLQMNTAKPPGKPKNTAVGSLSLFQEILPIQELNWGLLHHRWILYQLSSQGSPFLMCIISYSSVSFNHMYKFV